MSKSRIFLSIIIVILIISLVLTALCFTKISQDTTALPYGNLIITNDFNGVNGSTINTSIIENQIYIDFMINYQIYNDLNYHVNNYIEFRWNVPNGLTLDQYMQNYNTINIFDYTIMRSYSRLNGRLIDEPIGSNIYLHNYYITIDKVFTDVDTYHYEFAFSKNVNLSMDFNFLSCRNIINSITIIQELTQPPKPSGNGWDFVLDIFYTGWLGLNWAVRWVSLPIQWFGGVFIW